MKILPTIKLDKYIFQVESTVTRKHNFPDVFVLLELYFIKLYKLLFLMEFIGLAKRFFRVFHTMLWKNPNELFG